jgi:hypothetical protein
MGGSRRRGEAEDAPLMQFLQKLMMLGFLLLANQLEAYTWLV